MHVTSLELSKELYAISGLPGESGPDQEWYEKRIVGSFEVDIIAPKYKLGYLVRQLQSNNIQFTLRHTGFYWICDAGQLGNGQSTERPEDAVAMLIIELFQENILTREKE